MAGPDDAHHQPELSQPLAAHLAIVLDGISAQHTHRLPGLPPTPEQLDHGLGQWSCDLFGTRGVKAGP